MPAASFTSWRAIMTWIALGVTLLMLCSQFIHLTDPTLFPPNDSVEYWAAARLNLAGSNPYDPTLLLTLQHSVGWKGARPLIMYNPPWTLTLFMPLGLMPYRVARTLWLILLFILVLFASDWSWNYYGGNKGHRWLAWLLGLSFFPTIIVLRLGQIGPLMLLGLVGFLHFEKKKRWFCAGAATVLMAIKPQEFYLFWLALLFWGINRQRWSVFLGGIAAAAVAMVLPLMANPQVVSQFLTASTGQAPVDWVTPTIGALLRIVFGWDKFWLQFLATVAGAVWFVFYWLEHRRDWCWPDQIPILLMASLITTAYGWTYDQVTWIVVLIQTFVWSRERYPRLVLNPVLWGYAGLNLAILLARSSFVGISDERWYMWTGPLFLLIYLLVRQNMGRQSSNRVVQTAGL